MVGTRIKSWLLFIYLISVCADMEWHNTPKMLIGFNDPASAQFIGLGLHILTGTVAGNIFGQLALFWRKLIPYDIKKGVSLGLIVGLTLWAVLFLPLATFSIQPRLDGFITSAPNTYVNEIANHFSGLYPLIIGGSFLFHLVYGAILGLMVGRMAELRLFLGMSSVRESWNEQGASIRTNR
jgi:hypothetical protein